MKKLLMVLLVLSMVFSLAGCKEDNTMDGDATTPDTQVG
ncbi:MAG: C4-dicarboxylate ABC transporter, partial [Firmicutes bacterium HGW-Firmicutes-5]